MIVYVLFVQKISVSRRKVCIIFIKSLKFKKKPKNPQKHIFSGFFRCFFLVGYFEWVFYCQPCMMLRCRWRWPSPSSWRPATGSTSGHPLPSSPGISGSTRSDLPNKIVDFYPVLRIRNPGSCAFLTPGSGMGRKSASGSGIRDEQPGSYFLELRNNFFG